MDKKDGGFTYKVGIIDYSVSGKCGECRDCGEKGKEEERRVGTRKTERKEEKKKTGGRKGKWKKRGLSKLLFGHNGRGRSVTIN
jgi:hypothetical protein